MQHHMITSVCGQIAGLGLQGLCTIISRT